MAYDKPLKIQWTEINGRTVPLVLPQYWSDEQNDWVVSSEQNRLPVDAQLTGSRVKLRRVFESIDETVAAGEDIAVTIQPTEGYIIRGVVNFFLQAEKIPTATEGTHRFEIRIRTSNVIYDEVATVQTNHNNPITFRAWQESSNVTIIPSEREGFISVVKNIHATEGLPLILRYRNDTDGDQTGLVRMSVFLKEEAVTDD